MALSSWHQRVVVTVTWQGQIGASYERWALIGCSDIMDHHHHHHPQCGRVHQGCDNAVAYLTSSRVPRDLIVTLPRGDFDSCRMSSGSSRACNDFISTLMNELWFWVIFIMRIFVWDSPLSTMSAMMMMMMMLHSRSNSSCSNNFENHMNFRQNAAPTLCIVRRKNTCFLLYFTDITSLSYSLFVWLANQCAALWGARLLESWACWNYY